MNPGDAIRRIDQVMPFGDHLDELRRRLIRALVGVAVLFALGLYFGSRILEVLSAPLVAQLKAAGQTPAMLATSPLEPFGAYIKVATVAALVAGLPWILYQAWRFVAPGLYPREQRFAYFLFPLSGALTIVGMLVLYFVILPVSLYFLIRFGAGLIEMSPQPASVPPGLVLPSVPIVEGDPPGAAAGSMWMNSRLGQLRIQVDADRVMGLPLVGGGIVAQQYRLSEYVNLVFTLGLAFAVAFQVPMVLLLLSWLGIVEPGDLTKHRKGIIFGCVVGAALLPTQDPWSLILLSGMLIGLYELGVLLVRFVPARRVAAGIKHSTDADAEA